MVSSFLYRYEVVADETKESGHPEEVVLAYQLPNVLTLFSSLRLIRSECRRAHHEVTVLMASRTTYCLSQVRAYYLVCVVLATKQDSLDFIEVDVLAHGVR